MEFVWFETKRGKLLIFSKSTFQHISLSGWRFVAIRSMSCLSVCPFVYTINVIISCKPLGLIPENIYLMSLRNPIRYESNQYPLTLNMLFFFIGNMKMYLWFIPFLYADMTQVVEILPHVRQDLTYSTLPIPWVLMSWWHKEPGHQQPWYWQCWTKTIWSPHVNTLRQRRNEQHFADDIFKRIFFNENIRILIKISLKIVAKGPINNIPALLQIMAWRQPGDKPLSDPMMARLPTHICVTRPQWVKG